MQQRVFSRRRRRIVFNLPGRILELTGKYRLPAVLQPTPQRHIQRRRIQRVQLPDIVQRRLLPRPQQRLALHPVRPRHKNGRRHMRSLSARRILHSRERNLPSMPQRKLRPRECHRVYFLPKPVTLHNLHRQRHERSLFIRLQRRILRLQPHSMPPMPRRHVRSHPRPYYLRGMHRRDLE